MLKLCLMKYGVGHWQHIHSTGLLPGKLIGQLNGQTQRLLGQQSLAGDACCVDPAPIFLLSKSTHANTLGLTLFVLVTYPPAFTGLQLDVDRVRADNLQRTNVQRKGGLIIYGGPPPSRELKEQWRREAREK